MPGAALLAQAQALHAQARLAEAEALYGALLQESADDAPLQAQALAGLGLLRAAQGQREAAAALLRRAAALAPGAAELPSQLGGLLRAWGRHEDALECFAAALALAPQFAEAHYNHAQGLASLGRVAEAVEGYRAALALAPLGQAHARLAQALLQTGTPEAALPHFAAAMACNATDAPCQNDYGTALAMAGRLDEAIALFRTITAPVAERAAAQNNLGNALMQQRREAEAEAAFRQAIALAPDFALAHGNLGNLLLEQRRAPEALAGFERAVALMPDLAEYHHGRARTLVLLGDMAGAEAAFIRAVALAPDRPAYYAGLAALRQLDPEDSHFLALAGMAQSPGRFAGNAEWLLQFALYRALAGQGRHAEALAHLIEGNRLRRLVFPYDEPRTLGLMARIAQVFTPALLGRAALPQGAPDVPIFILGMPRSGSTLIEQILASHRAVSGAGEVGIMTEIAASLGRMAGGLVFPENMLVRTDAEFALAGADYRARLQALAPGAARITDKTPGNFQHIGLIRLALPRARIIHTRRSPMDICFSCFEQTFNETQPFANDLAELGRYHQAYARLMAHWRAVLPPGAMLEVEYEALVADFEPQVRRILAYCGLEWDPACLAFYEHERPVLTASARQVRQKLYQHAAGRSKIYGALLDPLRAALEEV